MSCLTGTFNLQLGPIIQVGVGVPNANTKSKSSMEFVHALIDTGATLTCISPSIVEALGLEAIGWREMASATHTAPVNVYLIDLFIRFDEETQKRSKLQVLEFAVDQRSPFQMLLGRDILCQGVFTLSLDGHFTFSL